VISVQEAEAYFSKLLPYATFVKREYNVLVTLKCIG